MLMLLACTGVHAYDFEKDGIYYNVTSLTDLTVEVTCEEEYASENPYRGDIVIPEQVEWNGKTFTVTGIGASCFSYAELSSIQLPETLTSIGSGAFISCPIQSIKIPDNVKSIESYAFSGCRIKSITLPNGLKELPFCIFQGCGQLENIIIPNSVERIGSNAFSNCDTLKSIQLSQELLTIEQEAFMYCTSLETITIPANVATIESRAFSHSTSLSSVTFLTNKMESFNTDWFTGCTSLTTVTVPEGVKRITSYGSDKCTSLTSIQLPETLEEIQNGAFNQCEDLTSVTLNAVVPPTLEYESFHLNTYLNGTLYVPKGCKQRYQDAENWNSFSQIIETDYVPQATCALTVKASGNGSVSYSNGENVNNGNRTWSVPTNSTVTLSISPDFGYEAYVKTIQADGSETTEKASYNLTVEIKESDVTVEVTFKKITVALTIQQAESGCVEMEVEYGQACTVRIRPEDGWRIHSVTFDGTDYTSVLDEDNRFTTPTLYEDASLNVAFEQDGNGISSLSSSPVKVYAQNGRLVVEQVGTGSEIRIYDSAGRTVKTLDAQGGRTETALPTGQVYIVKTVGKTVKIAL